MGISSSLYASISGLNTMGNAMSVLGDNVANVNTIAFKSSRATFQDVLSQSLATASGSAQVGRGVTLSTVDGLFAQGSFESTSTATDLAIGGQGFFMLRAASSAAADMYTRAGEFRFDQEGYLVSPVGHFVQGWTIDSASGEISGTIGDINLGKSTPPVSSTQIDVIVNVDARKANEASETRLFEAWDGRNTALATPVDPMDSANYEYTTAIKIYDSKGASHDITVYFDRTTQDNQWEFLVTCEPSEDLRMLTGDDQITYLPDTRYNNENHKGAGALMYGTVNFNTSGNIEQMSAWNVPPDGKVDPARDENRILLNSTDKYYSFEANFTGATTNQQIALNLGAQYSGNPEAQFQVLVSNVGAYADSGRTNVITSETSWSSVYDESGSQIEDGDVFFWTGYNNAGEPVSGSYVVEETEKISDFLNALGADFGAKATIDANGRLKLQDNTGGASGMYVTSFQTLSRTGADPFGGSTSSIADTWAVSGVASTGGGTITTLTALNTLVNSDTDGGVVDNGDTLTLTGFTVNGVAVNVPLVVGGAGFTTVGDLITQIESAFDHSVSGDGVSVSLDANGRIRVVDLTTGGNLDVSMTYTDSTGAPANGLNPFGLMAAASNAFTMQSTSVGQVDITTTKKIITADSRGLSAPPSGTVVPMDAGTPLDSIYDDANSGPFEAGDSITFVGTDVDGNPVTGAVYTVTNPASETVQDILDFLEQEFGADVYVDGAGRINLRARTADTLTTTSPLAISSVTYADAGGLYVIPEPFGADASSFVVKDGDLTEDGSQMGMTVTVEFAPEALASTQYANSSTTIFQDQDGFAAGFLQSVAVDTGGIITGNYSNGQVLKKAQVALASFNNMAGLSKEGGNVFRETTESGAPVTGAPGTNGLGSIAPNSLEQSNVDLGTEFVKLITTQRGFQANSKIITTTDEMLADLINIKR